MNLDQRIQAFAQLGNFLDEFTERKELKDYSNGVSLTDFNEFNKIITSVYQYNGWFTEEMVRKAIGGIRLWLRKSELEIFCSHYDIKNQPPKNIALILAGNIPFVGFHDVLCTLLCGHSALIKLSSDDPILIPALLKYLTQIEPGFYDKFRFAEGKINNYDAVIATGGDNTNRYFKTYFGKYPHIFRANRTSIAVLTGEESREDLVNLGHDIFDFYGLGCRNVSKILVPKGYELNKLFDAFFEFKEIVNHKKYGNNYDYNKAVYLLERVPDLLENGFLLVKKDKNLHSPLAVLFYDEYENKSDIDKFIHEHADHIQCVAGYGFVPFGKTQQPGIDDFADDANTMKFLTNLKSK